MTGEQCVRAIRRPNRLGSMAIAVCACARRDRGISTFPSWPKSGHIDPLSDRLGYQLATLFLG